MTASGQTHRLGRLGKHNEWHRSAAEAAELAMKRWLRLTANMSLGAYEVFEATGDLPEPEWPDLPFPGNPEDRFQGSCCRPGGSSPGAAPARAGLAMQALEACRRPVDSPAAGAGHETSWPADRGGAEAELSCGVAALPFREVWLFDFEFGADAGENPEPVRPVAWELRSGRRLRLWHDEFGTAPPYPTGPDSLFVAYYAAAEISCHLALAGRCRSECWTCSPNSATA